MLNQKAMKRILMSFFVAASTAGSALAHTGADGGGHHSTFMDGLLHPLSGTDHLAAMVAVGIWSAVALRTVWQAPLAFVALLAVGALAGFAGFQPPGVEPAIAASIMVLGLLISWRKGFPLGGVVSLVGVFAFFHGVAHGAELAGGAATGRTGGHGHQHRRAAPDGRGPGPLGAGTPAPRAPGRGRNAHHARHLVADANRLSCQPCLPEPALHIGCTPPETP
jgi:hydrogenase/urease accessory protein HupE